MAVIYKAMTKSLKDVLARAENWPEWAQNNLADIALEMDREVQTGTYRATQEELRKIDEALAAVRRGEVATADEVEAVFAKHRGACPPKHFCECNRWISWARRFAPSPTLRLLLRINS